MASRRYEIYLLRVQFQEKFHVFARPCVTFYLASFYIITSSKVIIHVV